MPTVAGIDTSLTSTGIATLTTGLVPQGYAHELHRVRSKGKADDTLAMRDARLDQMAGNIVRIVKAADPDLVVIESPAYSKTTGHMHDRSGLWWLVVFALHAHKLPIIEVTATARAKYATGKGAGPSASKDAVLTAVVRRYSGIHVEGNDQADALLLAAMGMRLLGAPIEHSLPQLNLEAMKSLSLPE